MSSPTPNAPATPWAAREPLWKRLLVASVVTLAPVLPAAGAALFSLMMMAFMADAGMPNEGLSELAVGASMTGLALGAAVGTPIAIGVLAGRPLRPFAIAAALLFALGAALYLGGFVAYFLSLTG